MNKTETSELMALIGAVRPKLLERQSPEILLQFWSEALSEVPKQIVEIAVKQLLVESAYVPDISEIVKRIKEITAPKLEGAKRRNDDWTMSEWQRDCDIRSQDWYEKHRAKLHAEGKMTAVECTERGLSISHYMAQFKA